jgi:hypothetical protein
VQIFSGYYATRQSKKQNAQFVGQKMQEWAAASGLRNRYVTVAIDFEPP